jgi:hypothetical protein
MRHFSSKGEGRCQKRNGNGAKRRVASRGFTGDIRIDIGAYRDLHRHRRCHKFRQSYSGRLGFDTPALVEEAGATAVYREGMEAALAAMQGLPAPGAHYLLPFGACGRFLGRGYAEAVSGQTSRSVRMGLRPTNRDEKTVGQALGGALWAQRPLRRPDRLSIAYGGFSTVRGSSRTRPSASEAPPQHRF